jgi:hypothetical protein
MPRGYEYCLIRFSAENSLLKSRCEGLEKALVNEKKKRTRGKPLPLEIRDPNDGKAIFSALIRFSGPERFKEAGQRAKAAKEEEKARRKQEKEEKRRLVEERKRNRAV